MNKYNTPKIGDLVKSSHPITCANPTETFNVFEIEYRNGKFYLRGEDTIWFHIDMITKIEEAKQELSNEQKIDILKEGMNNRFDNNAICPYPLQSKEYLLWEAGWWRANNLCSEFLVDTMVEEYEA